MTETTPPFDRDVLEEMNAKAVENEMFTPDHIYIDLTLMKDIPLGVAYLDTMLHKGERAFEELQAKVMGVIVDYQTRRYDTIDPYLGPLGYTDASVNELIESSLSHDQIFMVAPTSQFFNTLIKHTIRNQNHSGPANKFSKKLVSANKYKAEPDQVTFYLNTFPLTLSESLMNKIGPELGESFGVNIRWLNRDPKLFNERDWLYWLKKIDCYYLNSLGEFTGNPVILAKQGNMEMTGTYVFARKRFEAKYISKETDDEFKEQVQWITSQISMLCDFTWLQNNEVRLSQDAEESTEDLFDIVTEDGSPP